MNTFPAELITALDNNLAAKTLFEQLPPSHQREYARWITEAKQDITRQRRAERTVIMLIEHNASKG